MNTEPCVECGKPVSIVRDHWRIQIIDGAGNDMGWHAIGTECRKHHPLAEIFPGSPS